MWVNVTIYEISNSINHDDVRRNMELFFDEHMAMCNIISSYQIGIDVTSHADQTSITYKILPYDNHDIESLIEILSNATMTIYGHKYNISVHKEKDKLCIELKEKTPS